VTVTILHGDCRQVLRTIADESVHCCVTSPPYWRQRDYGMPDQIGLEYEPGDYIDELSQVFTQVRRVLRPDGVCWVNVGDKWASGGNGGGGSLSERRGAWRALAGEKGWRKPPPGYKDKDLVLAGFWLAERLRQDGWFLRKTIIWSKPRANEPPRLDRPSISHEYLFMLSKQNDSRARDPGEKWWFSSVWEIAPQASADHPAMMPQELVRRCIVSSSAAGDVVLDPFGGSGTTGIVADQLGRDAILVELNPEYTETAERRIHADAGMFADVSTLSSPERTQP
jgi:site-specific DNA-methyltransferase (cytosine-N4-specific)